VLFFACFIFIEEAKVGNARNLPGGLQYHALRSPDNPVRDFRES